MINLSSFLSFLSSPDAFSQPYFCFNPIQRILPDIRIRHCLSFLCEQNDRRTSKCKISFFLTSSHSCRLMAIFNFSTIIALLPSLNHPKFLSRAAKTLLHSLYRLGNCHFATGLTVCNTPGIFTFSDFTPSST